MERHLYDDEQMECLRAAFLKTGKGRRPTLPCVEINNRLLLQLYHLRAEGEKSTKEVEKWFCKLCPDATFPSDRIWQRINRTLDSANILNGEDLLSYLNQPVEFNFISNALHAVGVTRALNETHFLRCTVTNAIAMDLGMHMLKEGFSYADFLDKLIALSLNKPAVTTASNLRQIYLAAEKQRKKLVKNGTRDPQSLKLWLGEPFFQTSTKDPVATIPAKDVASSTLSSPNSTPVGLQTTSSSVCTYSAMDCVSAVPVTEDSPNSTAAATETFSPEHCKYCIENERIIRERESLIREKDIVIRNLEVRNEALLVENKKMTLECATKDILISNLQKEGNQLRTDLSNKENLSKDLQIKVEELNALKATKLYKKNCTYKRTVEELTEEKNKMLESLDYENRKSNSLTDEVSSLKKKLKTEQTMKCRYKNSLSTQKEINSQLSQMLQCDSDEKEMNIRVKDSSHRFSDNIRETFYSLQGEANVAASNCSKVISTVAKCLFKTELEEKVLPSKSTALNFANEAHIIAKEQVLDEIKKADHFTYASDGTSRDKAHFLEQHLHLSNGKTLSLGFSKIAADNSETLLEKCVSTFKDMCELHCLDDNHDEDELLKDIIRKLKCLLSDRAAVCKAFDVKMAEYKDSLLDGEDKLFTFYFAMPILCLLCRQLQKKV